MTAGVDTTGIAQFVLAAARVLRHFRNVFALQIFDLDDGRHQRERSDTLQAEFTAPLALNAQIFGRIWILRLY